MIDDLPELDELVGGYDPHQQPGPDVTGLIRPRHQPPMEAGMGGAPTGYNRYGNAYGPKVGPGPHHPMPSPGMRSHPGHMPSDRQMPQGGRPLHLGPGQGFPQPQPGNFQGGRGMPPPPSHIREGMVFDEDINPYPFAGAQQEVELVREGFAGNWGNCLDVSGHIENCPICSRLYKQDKTIMIIAIVILAIICILLLKKVLNL